MNHFVSKIFPVFVFPFFEERNKRRKVPDKKVALKFDLKILIFAQDWIRTLIEIEVKLKFLKMIYLGQLSLSLLL